MVLGGGVLVRGSDLIALSLHAHNAEIACVRPLPDAVGKVGVCLLPAGMGRHNVLFMDGTTSGEAKDQKQHEGSHGTSSGGLYLTLLLGQFSTVNNISAGGSWSAQSLNKSMGTTRWRRARTLIPHPGLIPVPMKGAVLLLTAAEFTAGIRRGNWRRRQRAMRQREAAEGASAVVASPSIPPQGT